MGVWGFGVLGFTGFKISGFQGFRILGFQDLRVSGENAPQLPPFSLEQENSLIQGFRVLGVRRGFKVSRFSGFAVTKL